MLTSEIRAQELLSKKLKLAPSDHKSSERSKESLSTAELDDTSTAQVQGKANSLSEGSGKSRKRYPTARSVVEEDLKQRLRLMVLSTSSVTMTSGSSSSSSTVSNRNSKRRRKSASERRIQQQISHANKRRYSGKDSNRLARKSGSGKIDSDKKYHHQLENKIRDNSTTSDNTHIASSGQRRLKNDLMKANERYSKSKLTDKISTESKKEQLKIGQINDRMKKNDDKMSDKRALKKELKLSRKMEKPKERFSSKMLSRKKEKSMSSSKTSGSKKEDSNQLASLKVEKKSRGKIGKAAKSLSSRETKKISKKSARSSTRTDNKQSIDDLKNKKNLKNLLQTDANASLHVKHCSASTSHSKNGSKTRLNATSTTSRKKIPSTELTAKHSSSISRANDSLLRSKRTGANQLKKLHENYKWLEKFEQKDEISSAKKTKKKNEKKKKKKSMKSKSTEMETDSSSSLQETQIQTQKNSHRSEPEMKRKNDEKSKRLKRNSERSKKLRKKEVLQYPKRINQTSELNANKQEILKENLLENVKNNEPFEAIIGKYRNLK
uniref:Uncharacterized protein n=1 Tax=Setaria digitata TaxID=48799 RepID=A0A915PTC3_9BILA